MTKKPTLLEVAKKQKTGVYSKGASAEEVEVALAWAKGEVSLSQIMRAMKVSNINVVYTKLAHCFKVYINSKKK